MKRIILLGATGSIGEQSIDVILHHPEEFTLVAMSAGHNINKLELLLAKVRVQAVNVIEKKDKEYLELHFPHIHFSYGEEGLLSLLTLDADVVINALVGFVGLKPSLRCIENNKILALANKESLVVGGPLVKAHLKKYNGRMYPIDSEHSAIFQCLQGNQHREIKNLVVSASGGSFRDKSREELVNVTKEDALAHPNWSMGARITIDSSTMMNKGFEVIEAHYLFDVPFENIKVIINRESVLHSMVQYVDNSFVAQLGTADMRLPIQYALTYPQRIPLYGDDALDLAKVKTLRFEEISFARYPLLELAYEVGAKGGNAGAIINGADEACIDLFLQDKISFLDIERGIQEAYNKIEFIQEPTYEQLEESDRQARTYIYDAWKVD